MFEGANRVEVLGMGKSLYEALARYEGARPGVCSSCGADPRLKSYCYRDPETDITTFGCCQDLVGRLAGVGRNDVKRTGACALLWDQTN